MFFYFAAFIYKIILLLSFLPISYEGVENIPQGQSIFISNHESSLDIMLVGKVLGFRKHIWLAKSDLWKEPLLPILLNYFTIPVSFIKNDENQLTKNSVVAQAKDRMDKGYSIILFPEAGRYIDGEIHPFKSGFAVLAYLTKKPVVPIFLHGVGKVMPPGSMFFKKYLPIKVIIGEPFYYQENESIEDFKQRVFNWYFTRNKELQENEYINN